MTSHVTACLNITTTETVYTPKFTLDEIRYPAIKARHSGHLSVSDLHKIWYEEYGNSNGIPVVFVHGGPAAGTTSDDARFFDPTQYRIILFDQRGAKRSIPYAELDENTPHHLIQDMETLRKHLNIDKWILFGGSWGSALSMLYGQMHPEHCLGFILRGVWTASEAEVTNLFSMGDIYPENYEKMIGHIPENERNNLMRAYYHLLCDPNKCIAMEASRIFMRYDLNAAFLLDNQESIDAILASENNFLAVAKLFTYYGLHQFFLRPNQILEDLHKIMHLPAIIVQGRYDIICRPINAYRVHKNWPGSELTIVQDAGHSATELGTYKALVEATNKFARDFI